MRKPYKVAIILTLVCMLISFGWAAYATSDMTSKFVRGSYLNVEMIETPDPNTLILSPGANIKMGYTMELSADMDCWLFAKLTPSDNFFDYMTYTIEDDWTPLPDEPYVYYRQVSEGELPATFDILVSDSVLVLDTLTASDLVQLNQTGDFPSLHCQCDAIQCKGLTPEAAWKIVGE